MPDYGLSPAPGLECSGLAIEPVDISMKFSNALAVAAVTGAFSSGTIASATLHSVHRSEKRSGDHRGKEAFVADGKKKDKGEDSEEPAAVL